MQTTGILTGRNAKGISALFMKRTVRSIIAIGLLVPFLACAQNKQQDKATPAAKYHQISAEEAKKMLDENSKIILLDVRSEAEYNNKHIPRATLLPLPEIESKAATALPDKDALILVYCQSGMRSRNASNRLVAMGYTQIYDIAGGISGWPYETE